MRLAQASTTLALFTAAIWLVHPLHTTAVTYIVQRTESLMGLFYLLTVYCAIRAFSADKKTRWYVLSILACALGMGAKESLITAPVVILIYDRIFVSRSFKELLAARWWYHLLMFATWAIVLILVFAGSRRLAPHSDMVTAMTRWQYFVTQFEVVTAVYLKLSFWPHPLVFDYGAPFKESLSQVIPYALFVLLLVAATVWALFKKPPAAFLGVWFFGNLLLTSSFLRLVSESIAERRMYLSLAALAAGAVIGAYLLFKRKKWPLSTVAAAGGIAVLALGILTFARNADFKSTETIWEDNVRKRPDNARGWMNLGNEYAKQGRHHQAADAFAGAVKANPGYPDAHASRGIALAHSGRPDQALASLNRAIELDPALAHAWRIRGSLHGMHRNYDQAIIDLTRAIDLTPNDAGAYLDRGIAHERKGDLDRAVEDYRKALQLDPADARARAKLESLRRAP
ncbi:tetratricopeptide repeat protein [Myxococcota bacterium]